MKIFLAFLFFVTTSAMAQQASKVPELSKAPEISPSAFGTLAGVAYACEAGKKLEDFEFIVSRILMNIAPSKKMETAYLKEYAQAKKTSMERQLKSPPISCNQFLKQFDKQKIFQSTVFSDGSVKNPDGTWLLPRGQKEPPKGY